MTAAAQPTPSAEVTSPEMAAYYGNRALMWRNLVLIMFLNIGWYVVFTVVDPLMQLRLNKLGVQEGMLGILRGVNSWAYSFLVMYFAWRSDHTVSRFGRRIPYLFISAPMIILCVVLFPLVSVVWVLVVLWLVKVFFMDIKFATIPLLTIDCMPRRLLARCAIPGALFTAVIAFFVLRYGMKLSDWSEALPYFAAASVLVATTLVGGLLIKEPPVSNPTTEKFRPWSAMKVAWKDRRTVLLMCAVTMSQSFFAVYTAWIWLYAKNALNLSRTETAMALSWGILLSLVTSPPFAWLVDRVSPYKLVPLLVPVAGASLWLLFHTNVTGALVAVGCLGVFLQTVYSAGDIMVYRHSHPAEIGSITSTNSCLRGVYNGLLAIGAGIIIERSGGNYFYAFLLGFALTTAAIGLLFYYRYLMKRGAEHVEAAATTARLVATTSN